MSEPIKSIVLNSEEIVFTKQQRKLINALLNPDLTVREDAYNQYAFFGGIRSGKSFLYQFITWLLCQKYKINVLYLRKYYYELNDSVIKQFRDDFEEYGAFEYFIQAREARFANGSVIKFRALDDEGTTILSSEYDLIVLCQGEEMNEEIYLTALGRLSGKGILNIGSSNPHPLMLIEGNPDSTWVKRIFKDSTPAEKEKKKIYFLEVTTEDNKENLTESYLEQLRANYPEHWIRRMLDGGWENIEEMVFSEFSEKKNVFEIVPPDIATKCKMLCGMDYGWINPTTILWSFFDYDGRVIIFDEWADTQCTPAEIHKQSMRYGKILTVADYSMKIPNRDGQSVWSDLLRHGMALKESNKDELRNIVTINSLLKTDRLRICRNCVSLIKEIQEYKWKRLKLGADKNREETPVQKDNHHIDALLYLVSYVYSQKSETPEQKAYKGSLAQEVHRGS